MNYYFPSDPPYFLFAISLVAGIACGRSFEVTLRNLVNIWSSSKSSRVMLELKSASIKVPYLGMTISIAVFMSTGLEVFGFPTLFGYIIAIPLTVGIALLVWRQLGQMLIELEKGGSAALDLDSFEG
ncbi:hypothetical protein VB774_07845 [Pseudanabaena galeata UHCC 0370]|uniref:Uncharacterized protein n=1 Tax=Pseudanabaena galeata UHCC 0370 TaxID=3110310 RepID=A0ABU5THI1_9CYAN|nr:MULTISPECIES: hypothetical protein [Pseudanabaena]MEA5477531.1 hypothetical protein [Pseudanabaena galeata UHCC 0370]MEA5488327.1 hypothetical protein [Pseudanabaena sp. CCNP1317]WGS72849.1 hypothetical protein OA858_02120 [Pseudanabaena galeata CCNP1313]